MTCRPLTPLPLAHRYIRTHIADSDHDLPADSIYRAFPRLVNELTRTVFSGTTWERATPVERFAPGLAAAVLSKQPPRCAFMGLDVGVGG